MTAARIPFLILAVLGLAAVTADAQDRIIVVMKDGSKIEGVLLEETRDGLSVRTDDGKVREIPFAKLDRVDYPSLEGGDSPDPAPDPGGGADGDAPPSGDPPAPGGGDAPPEAGPGDAGGGESGDHEPVLEIPELKPVDCNFCGGAKDRACWRCGGDGIFEAWDQEWECGLCKKRGKVKCEGCRGSGDTPDSLKMIQCPGCSARREHSLAPGMWACPSCWGTGLMWIEGEPKPRKCGVCKGKFGFACALCGGVCKIKRLFVPSSKRDAAKWLEECNEGLALLDAIPLTTGSPVEPRDIQQYAKKLPGLAKVAGALEAQLKTAQNLDKQNIEGSADVAQYFRKSAGQSVSILLVTEKALLAEEKGWVK